jgi:type IV pilus assembly protein PilP
MSARRLTAVVFASMLASACGGPQLDDLREFTQTAYADRKPQVEPLPEILPTKGYTYAATELVDPFSISNLRPTGSTASTGGWTPDRNRRKDPLEEFPLDALRMLGTITQGDKTWAVIGAPDGSVHHARVGAYMGQNYGVVTAIAEERISISEKIQDPNGNWIDRKASLATTSE